MLKKIKVYMLVVLALIGFVFTLSNVNAQEIFPGDIYSMDDLEALFDGYDVSITGNTVTLNENVTVDELISICDGEYTLDLNGHTLKVAEIYVIDGKLTINDATKESIIDTHSVWIEKDGTLVVNQGIFKTDDRYEEEGGLGSDINTYIENNGNLVLGNVIIEEHLGNNEGATLTIDYAEVPFIAQTGTAVIKDGVYGNYSSYLDTAEATIYGGEFGGFWLQAMFPINIDTMNDLIADGYTLLCNDLNLETYVDDENIKHWVGGWSENVRIVRTEDAYSDVFKKITADGTWEVEALKPDNILSSEDLLTSLVNEALKGTGYEGVGYGYDRNNIFDPEIATIYITNGEVSEEYIIKVKYLESETEKIKTIASTLKKMKYWKENEDMKVDNAYILDDLYLINYLFANTSDEIKGDQALNFSKDLIKATGGANISFVYAPRCGGADLEALYSYSAGQVILYCEGKPVASRNAALTASHVLYIPDTTEDTYDAYIAAALKRIKDYMGADVKIAITKGGKLVDLGEYNEYDLFDEATTLDNYYVVKINDKTYNFAICKKDASKLEQPKYVGMNIGNNISITTNSNKIPLDTAISAKLTVSDGIKKALGTDTYTAFDITLYSAAKDEKITKINDGEFNVSIPIPENLKGIDEEDLTVYYIDDNGKISDYEGSAKQGYISFETNHFSTYIIAEKGVESNITNPNTSDNLLHAVAALMLSIVGIVVGIKCAKK